MNSNLPAPMSTERPVPVNAKGRECPPSSLEVGFVVALKRRKCWTIAGISFHDSAGSQVRMVSRVGGSWGAPSLGVFIRPGLLISVVVPPLDS